jgi:DNA-binding SARP family transcriptional activator
VRLKNIIGYTFFVPYSLSLLGAPRLETPSKTLSLEGRLAAVLAYLSLEGATPKYKLAGLLWPDSGETAARNNMRQLLRRFRASAGDIILGDDRIELHSEIEVDVKKLSYLETPSLELLNQDAEFLEGLDFDDAPDFTQWLESTREELFTLRTQSAEREASRLEQNGNFRQALEYALVRLKLEPLAEEAYRQVAKLHYLQGDRSAALATLERCHVTLEEELGVSPLPETLELQRLIESGTALAHTTQKIKATIPTSISRPPLLAGREREWERMEAAWQNGQAVIVSGVPGVGKSRLVRDFATSKGKVVTLEGRPGDAYIPYATLTRTLRQTLSDFPEVALEPWVRFELARLLPEWGESAEPITSEAQKLRFLEALVWLYRQVSKHQPLVQVWDDLQFIDPASLEAASYVYSTFWGDQTTTVHTVMAYRHNELKEEANAFIQHVLEAGQGVLIELEPLSSETVTSLLESMNLGNAQGLAPGLSRYTGGNPLFMLETLKHLIETNTLEQGIPARLAPPGKVAPLIGRRLQRLSPSALNLARVAAVAETSFDLELAAVVLERTTFGLAEHHAELETAQIFRSNAFSHDLIREGVLANIPTAVSQLLHARTAKYLETTPANPATIANHWLAANQEANAAPWLLRAAEGAKNNLRLKESADFYEQAADIFEQTAELDRAFEARFARARQLTEVDPAQTERAITHLFQLARTPKQKAQTSLIRCMVLSTQGKYTDMPEEAERGLANARLAGDLQLEADLLEAKATLPMVLGKVKEAIPMIERMAEIYESIGDSLGLATATLGLGLAHRGDERLRAITYFEKAYTIAVGANLKHEQASALNNLGRVYFELGQAEKALQSFSEAAELLRDTGGAIDIQLVTLNGESYCRRALTDFAGSLESIERGLALSEGKQFGWRGMLYLQRALTLQVLGDEDGAREALSIASNHPGFPVYHRPRLLLANVLLNIKLEESLAEAREKIENSQNKYELCTLRLTQASLHAPEKTLELLQEALELTQAEQFYGLMLAVQTRRAQALLALNQNDEALAVIENALTLSKDYTSDEIYQGEILWTHYRVLETVSPGAAKRKLAEVSSWLDKVACNVPTTFREVFLNNNKINQAIRKTLQQSRETNTEQSITASSTTRKNAL